MKVRFALLLAIAFSASALAQGAATPGPMQFKSVEDTVNTYRAGLDRVMDAIPADVSDRADYLFPLSFLKRVVYAHASWGHIRGDGKMMAVSKGNSGGAWFMVLDLEQPALKQPGPTLRTRTIDKLVAVVIRPDLTSERWAGIFLIHELSHAYDALAKVAHPPGGGEFFAYDFEKRAYDLLSQRRFTPLLDRIVDEHGLQSPDDIHRLYKTDQAKLREIVDKIENELGETPALSNAEREMRDGFYFVAVVLRQFERQRLAMPDRAQRLADFMRTVSLY